MSATNTSFVAPAALRIPLGLKLAYTVFMAVLVPVYLRNYGPTNFLYFCDVALIITLVGIWIESPLLVSMCAVGIIASQTLWVIDFLSNLIGHPLTGLTDYMFMADRSLFLRGLSLFHGWLPFLLIYLVWRLGYYRRALPVWTVVAWALVLTHDVETAAGVAAIDPIVALERRLGLRSSWNFVPRRYELDRDLSVLDAGYLGADAVGGAPEPMGAVVHPPAARP